MTGGLPSRAAATAAGPCSGAHSLPFAPQCPGSDLESLSARAATAPGRWHCPARGSTAPAAPGAQQQQGGVAEGEVSYSSAQWGLPEVSSTTSWSESPFLLQLHIFKQENESVLSQPSQFLCRKLADVWELLGELYCPSCGCCMHMGQSHGKPLTESCLLLVSGEIPLCSPVKSFPSRALVSSLHRGLSGQLNPGRSGALPV